MDGEYVRFRALRMAVTADPLILYGLDGNLRTLDHAAEEVFYLHTLGWTMSNVTGTLFDDHNNDGVVDAGENIWHFAALDVSRVRFGRPIPMRRPKIITSGALLCVHYGNGFIRAK